MPYLCMFLYNQYSYKFVTPLSIIQTKLKDIQTSRMIQVKQVSAPPQPYPIPSPEPIILPKSQYYEPTTQQYQYKIFINECNSYIGSQLLEVFRNDDQIQVNPNIICGSLDKQVKTIGHISANHIIQMESKKLLNAVLKKSDIIVYSLNKNNARDFEYLIKYLRKTPHEGDRPQRVICVSSLLTWNAKRGSLDLKPTLDNLANRNSTQSYLMELQNLCLDMNNLNIGIQSYVVCSGIVYGYGQSQLFAYFKKALEQSQKLKVYGTGSNSIPMIHLEDLCNIIKDIAFTGCVGDVKRDRIAIPKSRYYFAVDNAKVTQLQLIQCIATTLGNGQIQTTPIQNAFLAQNFDELTIDLHVQDLPTIKNWHTIGGFTTNIEKIVSQFNIYRGLKPNKIIILGPPAAGKSKIAEFLEKAYGLPVLTIKKVLDQIQHQQSDFANEIKIKLEEIRTQKVQQQRKIFEEAKKKKKGKKDAADQFDASKIIPRLPDDQLVRVFKRRLGKSDCQNKGYILDGWPKTLKSCQNLFTNQNNQTDQNLLPNACFFITATQEQVKQRIKTLPQDVKETTHWNQQGTTRRFQAYNKFNEQGSPKSFFKDKVDIKQVPLNYGDTKQFIQFIQRNGPLGFKKKEKIQKKAQDSDGEKKQQQENQKIQGQEEGEYDQQNDQGQKQPENGQFDLQKLTEHQKQILNQKSRPIRQYLIDNVIPQITEGLLEICKQTPRDPIGFLIKFLQNKEAIKNKK